ncbi:hypothetical protein [uncultured Campylobacter sp.]|uniref:hypothetical protein n=1 Tax=uncultured Campylobacter sp. TaxID=218934 RepID=UPI00262450D2|nr:hypothetical protein [uncultured Campylobacter sp.]
MICSCCYDLDRLTLDVDIYARIGRYYAKRRRVTSAQNMKTHRYKRAGKAKAGLRFKISPMCRFSRRIDAKLYAKLTPYKSRGNTVYGVI